MTAGGTQEGLEEITGKSKLYNYIIISNDKNYN